MVYILTRNNHVTLFDSLEAALEHLNICLGDFFCLCEATIMRQYYVVYSRGGEPLATIHMQTPYTLKGISTRRF